jgi:RNA polymerase sigma factor (TIGR02999 family)
MECTKLVSNISKIRYQQSIFATIPQYPGMQESGGEVTKLLARISAGDRTAEHALLPLVYAELHRQAASRMRSERPGHTLQPTALVHEVYLRLCASDRPDYRDRAHFFRLAAQLMRRILIDHARRRNAQRRGSGVSTALFDESFAVSDVDLGNAIEVDDLLRKLAQVCPRQAQVVEMRFFAGLKEDDIAVSLGVDERTVRRDWLKARAWLHQQLHRD